MTVTAITDDADLEAILPPHTIKRLTPQTWTDWTLWHQEAWSDIKRHLAAQGDPIEEDDLSDPTEFAPAAIHHVAMQAFAYGSDHAKADYHKQQYLRILSHIKPTMTGSEELGTVSMAWGRTFDMERG
ncbi:MAG: hypothetical protein MUF10_11260 [Thermoanaerobaculaceae bacterium]|nr:hypothetical protein [Thermoanaerobaculaceae bacterium]